VDVSNRQFKKQVEGYVSASDLAEDHYYNDMVLVNRLDEDFVWLAIIELWIRIMPDCYNLEMIDDKMQGGYECLERRAFDEAMEKWDNAFLTGARILRWNSTMQVLETVLISQKEYNFATIFARYSLIQRIQFYTIC